MEQGSVNSARLGTVPSTGRLHTKSQDAAPTVAMQVPPGILPGSTCVGGWPERALGSFLG